MFYDHARKKNKWIHFDKCLWQNLRKIRFCNMTLIPFSSIPLVVMWDNSLTNANNITSLEQFIKQWHISIYKQCDNTEHTTNNDTTTWPCGQCQATQMPYPGTLRDATGQQHFIVGASPGTTLAVTQGLATGQLLWLKETLSLEKSGTCAADGAQSLAWNLP